MTSYTSIDEYIAAQPKEKRTVLKQLRKIIKKVAPEAGESISYGMPAFKYHHSSLVYFAAFKDHYGLYPTPKTIDVFKDKLIPYKTSKGAIQFPANKPIPEKLIEEIVKHRKESLNTSQLKDPAKIKKAAVKNQIKNKFFFSLQLLYIF